jgi:CelD/BcsL family acetyltransferase involved in cellulose biosynthesis
MPRKRLGVGVKSLLEMRHLIEEWEDLSRRSLEDIVYYTPTYALALLDTVSKDDRVHFVVVQDGPVLMALLPVVLARLPVPATVAAGSAWMSDYTFSTMPLIDKTYPTEAADAIVEGLQKLRSGEWLLLAANIDGLCSQALIDAMARRGIPWSITGQFERASISKGKDFEDYISTCISSKRRRELERCRRRLEELGEVRHEIHTSGEGLSQAVQAFLELEASGWKGEQGTALASNLATRNFALTVFANSDESLRRRADLLLLNGKPIAAGMIVFCGETGFTIKGGYDEKYSKYSAGLLLEVEVIKSFLSGNWAKRLDAATAGDHVIDQLWPDRTPVGTLVFSLSRFAPSLRLRIFVRSLDLRRRAKEWLKRKLKR